MVVRPFSQLYQHILPHNNLALFSKQFQLRSTYNPGSLRSHAWSPLLPVPGMYIDRWKGYQSRVKTYPLGAPFTPYILLCLKHTLTFLPISLQEPPVATADHVHQRWNQHQNFWRSMTRRNPNPELHPNHPDADILDCISHYIVEIEVPGVKDVSKLKIQWLDNSTLLVKGGTEQAKQPGPAADGDKDEDTKEHAKEQSKAREWPYLVIGERRLGAFERRFTFPSQTVEQENVKATLEAGLLTLKIPKHHLHLAQRGRTVEIESGDKVA